MRLSFYSFETFCLRVCVASLSHLSCYVRNGLNCVLDVYLFICFIHDMVLSGVNSHENIPNEYCPSVGKKRVGSI